MSQYTDIFRMWKSFRRRNSFKGAGRLARRMLYLISFLTLLKVLHSILCQVSPFGSCDWAQRDEGKGDKISYEPNALSHPISDALNRVEKQRHIDEFTVSLPSKPFMIMSCMHDRPPLNDRSALGFVLSRVINATVAWNMARDARSQPWNIWAPCNTRLEDRIAPYVDTVASGRAVVLSLPGKTQFASKVGLWTGLQDGLGEKASLVVPKTFTEPFEDITEFFKENPSATFIFKKGKHRQKGVTFVHPGEDVMAAIEREYPTVVQVAVDAVRMEGKRTAFRTYVWIRCTDQGRATALIDWRSPGYVAETPDGFIASGYTPSAKEQMWNSYSLLQELFPDNDSFRAIITSVERKVSLFLSAFEGKVCDFGNIQNSRLAKKALFTELFGFDWVPTMTATEKGASPDAFLLESNRYADMSLHTPHSPDAKDWLKICTVYRRLANLNVPSPYHAKCFSSAKQSIVSSDNNQ